MLYKNIFKIQGKKDLSIDINIYENPDFNNKKPLVIFAHGFKGFKDWGGFPYMLKKISDEGFVTAGFNFTYNGVDSEHPTEFSRLDLFAKNTFTRELDELECVINYFYEHTEEYNIDREKIALIGHSRGGGISIIKAAENDMVKCLITLASVSDFNRYTEEHKKKWREKGYFEVLNSRTNQMMRINSSLLDDIENNKSMLDITAAVRNLHKPFLIIHGKEDLSVRYSEAEAIFRNSDKYLTELFTVENTGHTFGTVHPFEGTTKAFEIVIEKIIEFLKLNFPGA